ncbi:MAG: signal peptidase II [Nanoarchaeota archaeon]
MKKKVRIDGLKNLNNKSIFFNCKYLINKYTIFCVILCLIILDFLTKQFFVNKTYFTNSIIHIKYVENFGSSFGIFSSFNYYSQIIAIISIILVIILIINHKIFFTNKILLGFFLFAVSGILGNAIDRIIYGYVIDFVAIKGFFIFNLADFYINLSILFLLIYEYKKTKKQGKDLKSKK